ncbi:MAG: hypothetical protein HFK06_04865 [Clostridia bacterium]|jgi:uncharacterized protein YaaR (DUF327 family)|nr:hypothetical protein [Clostridia bacterium]
MKVELITSYSSKTKQLAELDRQIAEVEERLKSPERTVEDIIRHIQLVKERHSI